LEIKYSFVIPIYNEKPNIEKTIINIYKYFGLKNDYEILFVDDISPDGSAEEVVKLSSTYNNVKLIQHGKKEGIGAALHYGSKKSIGKLIIFLDSDLSTSPEYLIKMINMIENQKYDMVIGSRFLKQSKQINKELFKKIGSKYFNYLAKYILNLNINDITHSFRVFKREIFYKLDDLLIEKGHPSFVLELTYLSNRNNYKIGEYPITFVERDENASQSKLSIKKELISSIKTIKRLITNKY
jgi:dolichol-phosphate mannosyltransferase|tara:strand:- start:63 stop:785 length:723 start_codon:yes stop_codon:yes gene_type:complete